MTYKTRPVIVMLYLATIVCIVTSLPASMNLPLVDPGLFVISGVKTCGETAGYCLLGSDCTADDDFLPDPSGHCEGLKRAFIPSAPFVCCKFNRPPAPAKPQGPTESKNVTVAYTSSGAKNKKWTRYTRQQDNEADPSKMDREQLEKLNQIGSVVKKIVEQLINETANSIVRADETVYYNRTNAAEEAAVRIEADAVAAAAAAAAAAAEAAIRNEADAAAAAETAVRNDADAAAENEAPPILEEDGAETKEIVTTVASGPCTKSEPSPNVGKSETETPAPETKEAVNESETPESDDIEESDDVDDEFKYEKNICQKSCKSGITFTVDKKPLCYGTLLDDLWILTSATCASRLNKADIRKVAVSRKDIGGATTLTISNILVHENFKSPTSKNSPENNDLALASLTVPLQGAECIPCFSQKSKLANEVCKTFQNGNFKNTAKPAENCEGRVQQRNLVSNSYLILPCSRWRMQYNNEGRLGSGLWCDGKLAGVQTGVGVGSLIYTPVNEYAAWISDNKRIEKRRR